MTWFVYIVRCSDDTLYTGITTDVERRVAEHNGTPEGRGAKYTKARRPVELVFTKACANRSEAGKEEYQIRNLPRHTKEQLLC